MKNESRTGSLRILICGAGVAGLSLAFWLTRGGHRVAVVERFPDLRDTGAQVDLRGQGIEAVRKMGLLAIVKSRLVDESGVAFVNAGGKARATIMADTSGKGRQTLTSEYEIMRGDLVRILYDAVKDDVACDFGQMVERIQNGEKSVVAHFSDGSSAEFDLLVGADGQGSRVRQAILGSTITDPYLRMGLHMAYWFIPRIQTDTNIRETYNAPGGRMIMRRSHNPTETQVYFALREQSIEASDIHRKPTEQQKQFWIERFRNAGWQTDRFIDGMKLAENFYSQEVVQVRMDTWSAGCVVLVGDAAHCASPFSGMGISGGLVGAYVLAGEISRNPENLSQALATYHSQLRPFIKQIQNVKPAVLRLGMPMTQFGIDAFHSVTALACFLRIPDLIGKFSTHDRDCGWQLPNYAELKIDL
jgi:2-polyprenyl-6-methoxyphenol hydroxylase-like FAD-dependent oxidoreductase